MRNTLRFLLVALTSVMLNGCAVTDWMIGGVGVIHTTRFTLDAAASDQTTDSDRKVMLAKVGGAARANGFPDRLSTIAIKPKPIAYYETSAPWPCFLKTLEADRKLSVELWQYYDKRGKTPLYKEAEAALTDELTDGFGDRLRIQSTREVRYPWTSD